MHVRLAHIETHTPTTKTFWFIPERMPYYLAGQFIELTLPQVAEHERNRRWFTLSSSPTEELLAITTHFDKNNTSAFKKALLQLQPGDAAIMSEPMGDFVLPIRATTPILYVAGGIGVTPLRSMLKWLVDTKQSRDITLLYAAHSPQELLFEDLFKEYGLDATYLMSTSSGNHSHEIGRISADRIIREHQADGLIYIAGPEPMTEQLVRDLQDKKISATRLVTDYFPGYTTI